MNAPAIAPLNKRLRAVAQQFHSPAAAVLTSKGCFLLDHFKITTSISSWERNMEVPLQSPESITSTPERRDCSSLLRFQVSSWLPSGCSSHSTISFLMVPMPHRTLKPRGLASGPELGQPDTLKRKVLTSNTKQPLRPLLVPTMAQSPCSEQVLLYLLLRVQGAGGTHSSLFGRALLFCLNCIGTLSCAHPSSC